VWFAVRETASLAAAISYLIDHPESVQRVGEKARQHVAASFNWDAIAGQYARVFESV
jgi:glycosyltransferase involved in cell wall biosynthesis